MTERLTLAEARQRAYLALLALPETQYEAALSLVRLGDWEGFAADFALDLATMPAATASVAVRVAFRAVARAFLAFCAHRDYEAGGKAERANAVALLREQEARFERGASECKTQEARLRCGDKASALRTMAAYIERGDRAEEQSV